MTRRPQDPLLHLWVTSGVQALCWHALSYCLQEWLNEWQAKKAEVDDEAKRRAGVRQAAIDTLQTYKQAKEDVKKAASERRAAAKKAADPPPEVGLQCCWTCYAVLDVAALNGYDY